MKKNIIFAAEALLLAGVIVLLVCGVNKILMPGFYYTAEYPTSSTYEKFYDLPQDSVDAVFLGTSHAASGFDPMYLYDNFGIKSYNLASGQQSLLASYYWLKEAFNYQSPEYVFLDVYYAFGNSSGNYLNCSETSIRNAIDPMHWGRNKWEAVKEICDNDESQSLSSYILLNERYHTRWKEISESDFNGRSLLQHEDLMGFAVHETKLGDDGYCPYGKDADASPEAAPLYYSSEEFLDRIHSLCEENGAQLVLVKTPCTMFDVNEHATTQEYADDHNIEFMDYNTSELNDEIGFEFENDMASHGHANLWGADKVTDYIGKWIWNDGYVSTDKNISAWEENMDYYREVREDCELPYIESLKEYLDTIKQNRYTVLMLFEQYHSDEYLDQVMDYLGQSENDMEQYAGFYAVIKDGDIRYGTSLDTIDVHGCFSGNTHGYEIYSFDGNGYISVDDSKYLDKEDGIFMLVYSNDRQKIVDTRAWQ